MEELDADGRKLLQRLEEKRLGRYRIWALMARHVLFQGNTKQNVQTALCGFGQRHDDCSFLTLSRNSTANDLCWA